jgi:hypothetical protein
MIDLDYTNLLEIVQPYKVSGRQESSSFLYWFLVNIYRLDIIEVQNIVCDGHGDKGIDGIYINDNEECIDVFQSKIVQKPTKTLGDTQLKEFIGSIQQLETLEGIDSVISSTVNTQLKGLITEYKEYFISSKYTIRGVFVTNSEKDHNAESLLESISTSTNLVVWDKSLISKMYVPSEKAIPVTLELSFDVFGVDYAEYNVDNIARVVIAPISATDLVLMEGIDNQQLFDLNLRKSLGKTKVNKDIAKSVTNPLEHKQFLLYHNGITVICSKLDTSEKDKIKIQGYSVVNGCQSVSSLYENSDKVTKDLRILTRIIEIEPGSELIPKITRNSNNQNGIKPRDFRSNTAIQVRLQTEINKNYPQYFYAIKSGDNPGQLSVIENELAGRILLAFDLKEPWLIQRTKKIFDESHHDIFARPEVTGGRIVVLFVIYKKIEVELGKIQPELFAGYQITKFFLLYLLAEVLGNDDVGKEFCKHPENFYSNVSQQQKLVTCINTILGDLIIDINGEFSEKGGENFDFKTCFKSPNLLRKFKNEVITSYNKLVNRGRVESFSQLWNSDYKI